MNNFLCILFWTFTYIAIIFFGKKYKNEHVLLMPLVAGSLNFAWEINAVVITGGYWGHVIWLGLDTVILIHNICYLKKNKQKWYIVWIFVLVLILYGVFHIHIYNGQGISVFLIDAIGALEYILCTKKISFHGKVLIAVLKLLGDFFAFVANVYGSIYVAVLGMSVLLLNFVYLAICLEEDARSRKKKHKVK